MEKVLGYIVVRNPAELRLPSKKQARLQESLDWFVGHE